MDADRPLVAGDHTRHCREHLLHELLPLGTRGHEVLEVASVPEQKLAGALEDIDVQPRDGVVQVSLCLRCPFLKRFYLGSCLLRKQEIRDADRKLGLRRQRLQRLVVVRVSDPAGTGIDCAGDTETVQLADEVLG